MPKRQTRHKLSKEPQRKWRYISFANNHGFLGAIVMQVPADGTIEIPEGIATGDGLDLEETILGASDMKRIPLDMRNRVLTKKEIRERLQ